jgi:Tol biopolymer transport system component
MRAHARLITILVLGCGLAATTALANSTTAPGKNGAIAFKRYLDSGRTTGAIFTMDANGKNVRQVTTPASGTVDDQPDWSPDGSLLVFYRCAPDKPCGVYTVKPDGSALAPRPSAKTVRAERSSATGRTSSSRVPPVQCGIWSVGTRSSTPTSSSEE